MAPDSINALIHLFPSQITLEIHLRNGEVYAGNVDHTHRDYFVLTLDYGTKDYKLVLYRDVIAVKIDTTEA